MNNNEWHVYDGDFKIINRKRNKYKNTSKEERAKDLGNIICPHCKYHNKKRFIDKFGTCHLCGRVLSVEHFKKGVMKALYEKERK